jgi:hypothetical protein
MQQHIHIVRLERERIPRIVRSQRIRLHPASQSLWVSLTKQSDWWFTNCVIARLKSTLRSKTEITPQTSLRGDLSQAQAYAEGQGRKDAKTYRRNQKSKAIQGLINNKDFIRIRLVNYEMDQSIWHNISCRVSRASAYMLTFRTGLMRFLQLLFGSCTKRYEFLWV